VTSGAKDEVATGAIQQVMDGFEKVMPLGEASKACALFSMDSEYGTDIFVSPAFACAAPQLLESFSAAKSDAPPKRKEADENGTALLLASHDTSAWSLLD
jgi:hypothetical protein